MEEADSTRDWMLYAEQGLESFQYPADTPA